MIKPEEIIHAEFSRSFLGYDMKEVDMLLDAVVEQMEAWEKERSEMLTALEYLLQEIEQFEQGGEMSKAHHSARENAAHIAQRQQIAAEKTTEQTQQLHAGQNEQKRQRSRGSRKDRKKEHPLPQAVMEQAEESQQIPLAKAPSAYHAESEFEIPTYVFAGSAEFAESVESAASADRSDHSELAEIPSAAIAEEIELAADASNTQAAANAEGREAQSDLMEQEA